MGKTFSDIEYLLRIPVVYFKAPSFNLVNFGLFASLGAMMGYSICFFYLYTRGVDVDRFCWVIAVVPSLLTILFAKLFTAFSVGISEYTRHFRHYLNQTTFYHQGGMIGAILGTIILSFSLHIPFPVIGDAMCLGGIMIMAIGRIGCHQYGCCTGKPTHGRFAIVYKDPDAKICRVHPELQNTPLIPVQGIASFLDLMIFLFCCLVVVFKPFSGLIMLVFIAGVNLKRIVIQKFRMDSSGKKIPYKLVAFAIIFLTILLMILFHALGASFFEKQYPSVPFTITNYIRFLFSDPNITASLIFVAVLNFLVYGVHGRIIETHSNLLK